MIRNLVNALGITGFVVLLGLAFVQPAEAGYKSYYKSTTSKVWSSYSKSKPTRSFKRERKTIVRTDPKVVVVQKKRSLADHATDAISSAAGVAGGIIIADAVLGDDTPDTSESSSGGGSEDVLTDVGSITADESDVPVWAWFALLGGVGAMAYAVYKM